MNACTRCRGKSPKLFCGHDYCPLLRAVNRTRKIEFKQDFFGKVPNVFVGRHNYPHVSAGIIGSEEATEEYDNPALWAEKNYQIENILSMRTSLVNSKFQTSVKKTSLASTYNSRFLEVSREISMAKAPVETEVHLEKKPSTGLKLSNWTAPTGPSAALRSAMITENPKVPLAVEKAVSDSDYKAAEAIVDLYKKRIDENHLTKLLSVGNLGIKVQRKLVPTRWSITAVDDTLGKSLISRIKNFESADYTAYFGGYLGNYYLVLLFPEAWSYELFETYMPRTAYRNPDVNIMTDYESYAGRKDYAEETSGGYYAARLGILEQLARLKRQAGVLALRFITEEYYAPLGVWVVRSAVRKALNSEPSRFDSMKQMIDYGKQLVLRRFGFDAGIILEKSRLLGDLRSQRRLINYL